MFMAAATRTVNGIQDNACAGSSPRRVPNTITRNLGGPVNGSCLGRPDLRQLLRAGAKRWIGWSAAR
jgi:hypothetical protein